MCMMMMMSKLKGFTTNGRCCCTKELRNPEFHFFHYIRSLSDLAN